MSERDPRIDPQPGDVLRARTAKKSRTVYSVDDGLVRFQIGGGHAAHWWGLQEWRRWAATAEVVHATPAQRAEAVVRVVEGK